MSNYNKKSEIFLETSLDQVSLQKIMLGVGDTMKFQQKITHIPWNFLPWLWHIFIVFWIKFPKLLLIIVYSLTNLVGYFWVWLFLDQILWEKKPCCLGEFTKSVSIKGISFFFPFSLLVCRWMRALWAKGGFVGLGEWVQFLVMGVAKV